MYRLIVLFAMCCIAQFSVAQNSDDFFKTVPNLRDSMPDWARHMYSANPNVGEVEDMFRQFYKANKFRKTVHTQNHKHWIRQVEPLIDENGYIVQPTRQEEELKYQRLRKRYEQRGMMRVPGAEAEWVAMGPFETYKANTTQAISWHKNVYAIDQSASNSNLLICGTEAGGVYKTTDKGLNWELISKAEVFAGGNSAVKIHPTNTSIYLVASNSRIYKTTDGGTSWNEMHYTGGTGNEFKYSPANNSIVFHTSTTGLFKSIDGGDSWTQIYSDKCWDIDFHPTVNTVAYLLKSNTTAVRSELFRSDDGGNTWTLKDNGYYVPASLPDASDAGGKIAVSPAAPNLVYVCLIGESKNSDDGWIGIYRSHNRGENWIDPSGQDGGPYGAINGAAEWNVAAYSSGYHQGFFNFDMEASQLDSNLIWVATIRLSESADGGATFESIGAANSNRLDDFHADVQDIEVIGNDIWVATDGGINYSDDTLNSHTSLNKGIQAAHFWGFNTGWNEDTYTGGKYHDGTSGWFENYGLGNSYNIGGVEEASGYVHPIQSRKLLFRTHYGSSNTSVKTIPANFGDPIITHNSFPVRPNESYSTAERSGVYYDPRYANHIYIGLDNQVHKSTDGGATFSVIYTFPNVNGMIYEMEISRSNPDVIYAVYNPLGGYWDPCQIWKSVDGGNSWNKTLTDPVGTNRRFRISIHPQNHNVVWACTPRGSNGGKVNSTTNGGATWTNRTTTTLDGEDLTDIYYQAGSNEIVYVVGNNGVFYWDAGTSDWLDYSLGLPLIAKSLQINPFYRDAELRLASNGRGVWAREMKDTTFTPIAQPITYSDSLFCSRDTADFDCYSILKHHNASWDWSFSPAPAYISSTSARNPRVVFGADGSYDVTLTVTDGQGNSNAKTVTNMVTVLSNCEADSVIGNALTTENDGDYFTAPDFNLTNITHFTTTAWIYPDTAQAGFAAIVSNGEWCAHCNTPIGLIIDYWGSRLYYRWPDGSGWGSNSGMTVPLNQWSYVAMVVTPDSVTLYLNEQRWVSYVTLSPVDIPALYVGKGHYSKYFKGKIDEVTIWNRALSQDEIRDWRHLTKRHMVGSEPGLVAYYQFNEAMGNQVLDNGKMQHGSLIGGAVLTKSTAPVGPGQSARMTISGSGPVVIGAAELDFGALHPNDEIVVSRLNVLPDSLPNSNPSTANYWIVNNYGTTNFNPLNQLKLMPNINVPFGNPANARLFVRSENEHRNNWQDLCSSNNYAGGSYNFNSSCNITNTHQFFIQSQNANAINGQYILANTSQSICTGDSIFLAGAYQTIAGSYHDTLHVSPTVDSVVITLLNVGMVSISTDVQIACDAFTWINSLTYTASNNTAVDTISGPGCDSIVSLDLTIVNSSSGVDVQTSCGSFLWIDGNTYTANNNTATHIIPNAAGCDSLVALNLTIKQNSAGTDVQTACNSFLWIDGNTYTSSNNTATHILPNAVGCDSVVTLNLSLNIVSSGVTQTATTLTATAVGAVYQWLDCDNNFAAISGANAQSFTATANGNFAVSVSQNSCTDTSTCLEVSTVGILVNDFGADLVVYPNPTNGNLFIELGSVFPSVDVKTLDVEGRLVATNSFKNAKKLELSIDGAVGVYILEILSSNRKAATIKVLKE